MAIRIERLTPARVGTALQVFRSVLGTSFPLTAEETLARLINQQGIFYIAIDTATEQVVGLKFGFIDDQTCLGRGIGVLPAYRRQGIATRLLRSFERELAGRQTVQTYVFGSATHEGVPFHVACGYQPKLLIQFSDPRLRDEMDLSPLNIVEEGYHPTYHVYQIYATLEPGQGTLDYLRRMQECYPQANLQFFFNKEVSTLREAVESESSGR